MMYAKAERLISNSDILPAPRARVSFKSVSDTAGYHIKTIKENNEALCDCKSVKGLKMCCRQQEHTHMDASKLRLQFIPSVSATSPSLNRTGTINR